MDNCKYSGNEIVLNEARAGKGEQLRAGKPRKEDEVAEDKHSVNREEFRGQISIYILYLANFSKLELTLCIFQIFEGDKIIHRY